MAEDSGSNFPLKHLPFKQQVAVSSNDVAPFVNALNSRNVAIGSGTGYRLLPNMASANRVALTGGIVYSLTGCGWFYYQHWKGTWSPTGGFSIDISTNAGMTPAYRYVETKDTGGTGNDHSNMIFIRAYPGKTIYFVVSSTISDGKKLYFIPSYDNGGSVAQASASVPSYALSPITTATLKSVL